MAELTPLLNADGLPVVRFGGAHAHKQRTVKGYVVSFEWCMDPDDKHHRRVEPCIAIWSDGLSREGAWVITRRGVMGFCDQHNRPTPKCFREAAEALPMLGYMALHNEIIRLVDVVMDSVDDLVQMPSAPRALKEQLKGETIWEIERRDLDRKVIAQAEV